MAFQLFPSFSFNESNVGPRPVRSVTRDRVALVGVFKRGPVEPAICDPADAKNLFGFDESVGSAHLQAVLDQGVGDVLIKRVVPLARSASKTLTLSGTVGTGGTLTVHADNGTTVTTHEIEVTASDLASAVANEIKTVMDEASGTGMTFTIGDGNAGTVGKLVATANEPGTGGNELKVRLELGTVTGLTVTPAGIDTTLTNLEGGIDTAKAATVTLLAADSTPVLKLELIFPGAPGNSVTATVAHSLEAGKFDLQLNYTAAGLTQTLRDVDLTDVYDEDKLFALQNSILARGTVLDATKVPVEATVSFSGGTDGDPVLKTEDFLAAIDDIKDVQCTIITCPGLKPVTVNQGALDAALVAQAEAGDVLMGEMVGLRVAVISAPRGTQAAGLAALKTAGRILPSQRCVMVAGWGTSQRVMKFKRFGIDPAAVYAGHLQVTAAYISPAARTSSPSVKGISEVDIPSANVVAMNEFTRYRLECIVLDPVIGGFHCLNGQSTSADPAWKWICIRRLYDVIRTDIFFGFQWTKSEPNTPDLDSKIMNGVDAYLDNKLRSGWLNGYDKTVSDDSNNKPEDRALGQRFVDIGIEPIYPNDNTQFNLNRVLRGQIRLS